MCLAQGPQRSDAGEARTRRPSLSSQALYHWATALTEIGLNVLFLISGAENKEIIKTTSHPLGDWPIICDWNIVY